tara:strand:- start:3605 stop:4384 length:780 start_codon:yes stop_codon:yes gene_type:complete
MKENNGLYEKVVIITGSNGQLGRIYCEAFAQRGSNVIATDIQKNPSPEIEMMISKNNNSICYKKMNVASEEDTKRVFSEVYTERKKIDVLINNAGIQIFDHFTDRKKKDFMDVMEVNVFGTFNCIKTVCDFMKKNDNGGSIVNVGSIYGLVSGDPRIYTDCARNVSEAYSASKAAIIQLTKYFAIHLSEYSIRVNVISPGGVYNHQGEEFVVNYSAKVPMNRMANQEEMISGLLYLSDNNKSSYVNGHNLVIDGGFTAW